MTLRLLWNRISAVKRYNFVIMYATFLWTSYRFPNICKPSVVYQFYCMALFHSQMRLHMINHNLMSSGYQYRAMQFRNRWIKLIYQYQILQIKICFDIWTYTGVYFLSLKQSKLKLYAKDLVFPLIFTNWYDPLFVIYLFYTKLQIAYWFKKCYWYHKLRKTFFLIFFRRIYDLISKFHVRFKSLFRMRLSTLTYFSKPEFYGDLVHKLKKTVGTHYKQ